MNFYTSEKNDNPVHFTPARRRRFAQPSVQQPKNIRLELVYMAGINDNKGVEVIRMTKYSKIIFVWNWVMEQPEEIKKQYLTKLATAEFYLDVAASISLRKAFGEDDNVDKALSTGTRTLNLVLDTYRVI